MRKLRNAFNSMYQWTANNLFFSSVRLSFLYLSPVFLLGAFSIVLQNFPIEAVRVFFATAIGGRIDAFLQLLYNATYGFASVYLVIALSYVVVCAETKQTEIRAIAVISSLACFFAFFGPEVFAEASRILNYTRMSNVFSALVVSFLFTKLFIWLYKVFYKKRSENTTSFVRVLRGLPPLMCCLALAVIVAVHISFVDGVNNFDDLLVVYLGKPFQKLGATYAGGLLIMFLESVFWLFGIHGGNVFDSLLTSDAFSVANGQIMSKPFIDTFALMGGCGATVCLLIALLIFSNDAKKKKLGYYAIPSVMFNINELIVFGLPVVLNPIYAIPFILTPMVCYSVAYAAVDWGIVAPIVNANVPWTTPVIISGFQATNSVSGSLLQLALIAIGTAIYMPFVWLNNYLAVQNESKYLDVLTDVCKECEKNGVDYSLEGKTPVYSFFENDVAAKIDEQIRMDEIYLQYQPQVKDGRIVSAEALLRFKYGQYGYVYPPLVVGIANAHKLFEPMSRAIVSKALGALKQMQTVEPNFCIAVNLQLDLILNTEFRRWLIDEVTDSGITPRTFGVEITEDGKLVDNDKLAVAFDELKSVVDVQMDDFSMGHTSISILQKNYFNYIKIDGNLVRMLDKNERSRSIVSSIVRLGKQLNFTVIAEFVETPEQRDMLAEMGCHIYQGYLYYKDMPADDLEILLKEQKSASADN